MNALNITLRNERTHARTSRGWGAALFALALPLMASTGQAQTCPTSFVAASNGATLASCTPATDDAKQAVKRADGAACPTSADARVRDIVINSRAMNNKPMKTRLILPSANKPRPSTGWPVLLLLTGHGASYESWTCATKLRQYVNDLGIIVAMPEGSVAYATTPSYYSPDALSGANAPTNGIPGWYSDWQTPLVNVNNHTVYGPRTLMNIRTHHLLELREILVSNFRADDLKFAVAGLSMGGFGATSYALGSTPTKPFIAAASFSGLLDTELYYANIPYVGGFDATTVVRGSIELPLIAMGNVFFPGNQLWGEASSQTWKDNNVKRKVQVAGHKLSAPFPLYISVGQGTGNSLPLGDRVADGTLDPVEVGAHEATRSFVNSLGRSDSRFVRQFFPRGKHDWKNWNVAVCYALNSTLGPALTSTSTNPWPTVSIACPTDP